MTTVKLVLGTLHLREFQRIAADMSVVRGVDPEGEYFDALNV